MVQDSLNDSKVVVTGCAGFIGSHLVDHLLSKDVQVIGIDNFSTGNKRFLADAISNQNFHLYEMDLLDLPNHPKIFEKCKRVYHLAANADVRFGPNHPRRDLEQNVIVTHNVLESMRINSVNEIVFSSTGSVYGESSTVPTPEFPPFPVQTSLYGASKSACEGLISAYCEAFRMKSWIFRFVSILGPRYSHGHVFDFMKQLRSNPNRLNVLGNGLQKKSYLHVSDCIDGIFIGTSRSDDKINIFNLGLDYSTEVKNSITWISETLNLNPHIEFENQLRGWVGDNPNLLLDASKIKSLGWSPKNSIHDGITDTIKYLLQNDWIFLHEE